MKQMLLGIFLLLLSIWCLLFGVVDDLYPATLLGVALPLPAIICFAFGFRHKDD